MIIVTEEIKKVLAEIESEISKPDANMTNIFSKASNLRSLVSIDFAESSFNEENYNNAVYHYCNALSESHRYQDEILPKLKSIIQKMPELLDTFPQFIINNWGDKITKDS